MGRKITTEEFILRATTTHGGKYDYSNTALDNGSRSRITYRCKLHGGIEQLASGHLQGKGCVKCSGKEVWTPESLKKRALKVHGDTYDYSNTDFSDVGASTVIGCDIHGEVKQTLRSHIRGGGCGKCGQDKTISSVLLTTSDFIDKANKVHKGVYTYKNTVYENSETKVSITCNLHGEFYQVPHSHLKGSGCRLCANVSISNNNACTGWSYTDWDKQGKVSKEFKGFSLYVIECTFRKEKFIKVGKTFTDVKLRFKSLPYRFKVVTQVYHNAFAISNLEAKIHKELKDYKYSPNRDFKGRTECYTIDALSNAIEHTKDYSTIAPAIKSSTVKKTKKVRKTRTKTKKKVSVTNSTGLFFKVSKDV